MNQKQLTEPPRYERRHRISHKWDVVHKHEFGTIFATAFSAAYATAVMESGKDYNYGDYFYRMIGSEVETDL